MNDSVAKNIAVGDRVTATSPGGRAYRGHVIDYRWVNGVVWYTVRFYANGRREEIEFPSSDIRAQG